MTESVLSKSNRSVLQNILSDLDALREVRKDSTEYLDCCKEIASKLEAALAEFSDGEVAFSEIEKNTLLEIYSQLAAEETFANASADLRNVADFSGLLKNG